MRERERERRTREFDASKVSFVDIFLCAFFLFSREEKRVERFHVKRQTESQSTIARRVSQERYGLIDDQWREEPGMGTVYCT